MASNFMCSQQQTVLVLAPKQPVGASSEMRVPFRASGGPKPVEKKAISFIRAKIKGLLQTEGPFLKRLAFIKDTPQALVLISCSFIALATQCSLFRLRCMFPLAYLTLQRGAHLPPALLGQDQSSPQLCPVSEA